MDNCNCMGCRIRRNMEAERDQVEAALPDPVLTTGEEAQNALMHAQTVHLLADSLVKLIDMGLMDQVDGVIRTLDRLLPPAVTNSAETAPDTEAPTVDEFEGVPEELKDQILSLRAKGIDCGVIKFSL